MVNTIGDAGADSRWDYRRPAAERINAAVLKMPMERANGVSLRIVRGLPAGGPISCYPITQKLARIIAFIVRLR